MQYKENWLVVGLLLIIISMQMESWGKYVLATFAALFVFASFAPKDDRRNRDFKRNIS